jgi:MOSC domain-containing protein YiiM
MGRKGRIAAVCISQQKGEQKRPVESGRLIEDHGIEGDAHAGTGRQMSLLCGASVEKLDAEDLEIGPGDFAENLLVDGLAAEDFEVGTRFTIGGPDAALLEVTQIGKKCHEDCVIRRLTGDCVMPREGIFARVLCGGEVRASDEIEIQD